MSVPRGIGALFIVAGLTGLAAWLFTDMARVLPVLANRSLSFAVGGGLAALVVIGVWMVIGEADSRRH